ncbi:Regulator of chromosome condensation 1/beta-lactamase-inhibitor protein II [Elaphomyces granulatus]
MQLFAFGSNGSGQLGIGHLEDVSAPTKCVFPEEWSSPGTSPAGQDAIIRVVAGGNHTLILFRTGAVYATGSTENGRCGFPVADQSIPETGALQPDFRRVLVHLDGRYVDTFKAISATWEASFLVSTDDEVFVLGFGSRGELGLGKGRTETVSCPGRIPEFPPQGTQIVAISSGIGHTVVVLSNGDVYGWGGARKGQLGVAVSERKVLWTPEKVDGILFRATGAACGREFTIVAGSPKTGEFIVIGSDKWGVISGAPQTVIGHSVAASWNGIYVHQPDMSIKAWGRNDRGQLPPSDFPKPKQIAVGSEHAVALLDDQTIVAFGWGEHGNCGPETDAQGNVKERWSQISLAVEDVRAVSVAAGCATSWVITS